MQMNESEYALINELEHSHWWYKQLHSQVLSYIKKYAASKDKVIVDAGCGTGGLIEILQNHGYTQVQGFDLSLTAVNFCLQKHLSVAQGDLRYISSFYEKETIDVLVANDNLYFLSIEEQKQFLKAAYSILKPGGILIMNLPALKAFKGWHDQQVGIKTRFNTKLLAEVIAPTSFKLLHQHFWPFLLSPLIFLVRYIQRFSDAEAKSDLKKEPALLNSLFGLSTTLERYILIPRFFGSSLFVVLKK